MKKDSEMATLRLALGVIGMALVLDKSLVAAFGLVSAFVIGDLVKVVICGFVTQAIYRAQPDKVLSRA